MYLCPRPPELRTQQEAQLTLILMFSSMPGNTRNGNSALYKNKQRVPSKLL